MSRELRKHGLMVEDILIEEGAMATAVSRLPDEVRQGRDRRQIRAMDLSLKGKYLSEEEQQSYDPMQSYMGKLIEKSELEAVQLEKAGR